MKSQRVRRAADQARLLKDTRHQPGRWAANARRSVRLGCWIAAGLILASPQAKAQTDAAPPLPFTSGNWTAKLVGGYFFDVWASGNKAFSIGLPDNGNQFMVAVGGFQPPLPDGIPVSFTATFDNGQSAGFSGQTSQNHVMADLDPAGVTAWTQNMTTDQSLTITFTAGISGPPWKVSLAGAAPTVAALEAAIGVQNVQGLPAPWNSDVPPPVIAPPPPPDSVAWDDGYDFIALLQGARRSTDPVPPLSDKPLLGLDDFFFGMSPDAAVDLDHGLTQTSGGNLYDTITINGHKYTEFLYFSTTVAPALSEIDIDPVAPCAAPQDIFNTLAANYGPEQTKRDSSIGSDSDYFDYVWRFSNGANITWVANDPNCATLVYNAPPAAQKQGSF